MERQPASKIKANPQCLKNKKKEVDLVEAIDMPSGSSPNAWCTLALAGGCLASGISPRSDRRRTRFSPTFPHCTHCPLIRRIGHGSSSLVGADRAPARWATASGRFWAVIAEASSVRPTSNNRAVWIIDQNFGKIRRVLRSSIFSCGLTIRHSSAIVPLDAPASPG
jgi:hypothetical protein